MGGQHYMPAGFIGAFGVAGRGKKKARNRRVWVARRGNKAVFQQVGTNVGIDEKRPRLYDGVSGSYSFDPLLTQTELVMGHIENFCAHVFTDQRIDARLFVTGMVPFVAGLMVRHPDLPIGAHPSLGLEGGASPQEAVMARHSLWNQAVDHLLYNTRWTLVESQVPLMTTDLGFLWRPGLGVGSFEIPLHPHALLVLTAGRTYYFGDRDVRVSREDWSDSQLIESQMELAAQAPHEAYGMEKWHAELALASMSSAQSDHTLVDSRFMAYLAGGFGASNPILAFRRFHLAQEDVQGCECRKAVADNAARHALTPDFVASYEQAMKVFDRAAAASLPQRGRITAFELLFGGPYLQPVPVLEG